MDTDLIHAMELVVFQYAVIGFGFAAGAGTLFALINLVSMAFTGLGNLIGGKADVEK